MRRLIIPETSNRRTRATQRMGWNAASYKVDGAFVLTISWFSWWYRKRFKRYRVEKQTDTQTDTIDKHTLLCYWSTMFSSRQTNRHTNGNDVLQQSWRTFEYDRSTVYCVTVSLPPTKEEVNAFARVCLSVCLSVSKITQKRVHGFGWKCCVSTDVGTWTNRLIFLARSGSSVGIISEWEGG